MGKVIKKVVPREGVLATRMVPLCRSTMCLTMESPKPVPPRRLERDLSTT